jgi:hypothetical protein
MKVANEPGMKKHCHKVPENKNMKQSSVSCAQRANFLMTDDRDMEHWRKKVSSCDVDWG